jgi:hypothetical protein
MNGFGTMSGLMLVGLSSGMVLQKHGIPDIHVKEGVF